VLTEDIGLSVVSNINILQRVDKRRVLLRFPECPEGWSGGGERSR